jgi:phosphoglycolate phosphatase
METPLGPVRAALLDLDGTLIDTLPDLTLAVNRMRAERHLAPLTEERVARYIGKGSEELVRRALEPDMGADDLASQLGGALDRYLALYAEVNGDNSTLYPGVRDGLEDMRRQGHSLACVTNKPHRLSLDLLERFAIAEHFTVVIGGDSQPEKKPEPGPLLAACRELGVAPAQAVMIGDSDNDAVAARRAGCRVLLVPYGYHQGDDVRRLGADGIVDSLLAAADWIDATNRGLSESA